jgi:outer membrane protein assembly factor BamE (lipoprotein component of BamABCDE complex)
MSKIAASVVLACSLAGCASYGSESIRNETDETLAQKIQKGLTTKAQVRSMLGDPLAVTLTDAGNEQWMYHLASYTPSPINFVPYLNSIAQAGHGQTKNAVLLFDKNGIVMQYTVTSGGQEVRGGILGAPVR